MTLALAETDGSTPSRVASDLIRDGLSVRQSAAAQDWLTERLSAVVDRLERLPLVQASASATIEYEQHVIGAALSGDAAALASVRILTPDVFSEPVHRAVWQAIQHLGYAASAGGLLSAVGPLVAATVGQSVTLGSDGEMDTIDYLATRVESARTVGHIERSVFALVDAALVREQQDAAPIELQSQSGFPASQTSQNGGRHIAD